jgi:hypothetical protein
MKRLQIISIHGEKTSEVSENILEVKKSNFFQNIPSFRKKFYLVSVGIDGTDDTQQAQQFTSFLRIRGFYFFKK